MGRPEAERATTSSGASQSEGSQLNRREVRASASTHLLQTFSAFWVEGVGRRKREWRLEMTTSSSLFSSSLSPSLPTPTNSKRGCSMDWPPEPHKRKPSTRQRNPYQQQQHHHSQPSSNRQARAQAPSPPDLTSPILVFLALAFLFAYFYTFGLPIEIELNLRRLKRTLKRMGFLSWWSGKGGGGSVELASGDGSTGRITRRRRGGELNGTGQSGVWLLL